jgi:hypothetical protein
MAAKRGPGALAGAAGGGLTSDAVGPDVTSLYTSFNAEWHHRLRLDRLRHRHGLTGSLAETIAQLCYDGGPR